MPINGFNGEYRFLSNFWPCQIEFEGLVYQSTEAAYQAAKTHNNDKRWAIAQMSASESKRAGRALELRSDWEDVKLPIMKRLLQKKFYDPELGKKLLETSEEYLEETNYWHDNFWGNCTCTRCAGKGQNYLGKYLMEVRQELSVSV